MEANQLNRTGSLVISNAYRAPAFAMLMFFVVMFAAPVLSLAQPAGSGVAHAARDNSTTGMTRGLISYWAADGDARDSIGTNHGSLINGVGFADGVGSRAFNFNGRGAFVYIPGSESLDVGNQLTVELWMKPDSNNIMQNYQGLVASDYYVVEIANGYGRPHMGVHFGLSTDASATVPWPQTADANDGGFPVSPGVWHHVAATYDGTKLQLYVDGQLAGNPVYHSGAISPMRPREGLTIGAEERMLDRRDPSSGRFFNGLIDEVAIYNRALSADEIKAVFAAGSQGSGHKAILPAVVNREPRTGNARPVEPAAIYLVAQIPTLSIFSKSGSLTISWPAPAVGFVLEGCDSLPSANWTTVDATPITNSSEVTVTIPNSSSQAFYRLNHP